MRLYSPFVLSVLVALGGCDLLETQVGQIQLSWKIGSGIECSAATAAIDTIKITVTDSVSDEKVVDKTYACSAGKATITKVPVGTYAIEIEGSKEGDSATFRGTVAGVEVYAGKAADAGTVELEKLPPTTDPGGLRVSWTFGAGLCGANNVSEVRLVVWKDSVYRSHDQIYPCDLAAPGYVHLALSPALYDIELEGLGPDGKQTAFARKNSVTITEGETTDLTGSNAFVLEPLAP
jgi:hypothetical protein